MCVHVYGTGRNVRAQAVWYRKWYWNQLFQITQNSLVLEMGGLGGPQLTYGQMLTSGSQTFSCQGTPSLGNPDVLFPRREEKKTSGSDTPRNRDMGGSELLLPGVLLHIVRREA